MLYHHLKQTLAAKVLQSPDRCP